MNLQTHIREPLWNAISSTYLSENYSHAVLDAMHYLTDVIREKSGASGDGHALVHQALGGDFPKLRINKLQTESERDEQKGFLQILMGFYLAIRNPRSHEQIVDDQATADAIIYFIDYMLRIIDRSRSPFAIEDFLLKVLDPAFVQNAHYAQLLIEKIPPKKRLDTLIEVYRKKLDGNGENLAYFTRALVDRLESAEVSSFLEISSEELETTQDANVIIRIFQILPPNLWPQLSEVARLRIENKVLNWIKDALIEDVFGDEYCNTAGNQAIYSIDFIELFDNKVDIGWILIKKINSDSDADQRFVAQKLIHIIPKISGGSEVLKQEFVLAIVRQLRSDNIVFKTKYLFSSFPSDWIKTFNRILPDLIMRNGIINTGEEDDLNISDIPF